MSEEEEFNFYRKKYLDHLNRRTFPWDVAYHYYLKTTDRIDVFGFEQFQEDILYKNSLCESEEEAWTKYSYPIYKNLDEYFTPAELINKEGEVLMIC